MYQRIAFFVQISNADAISKAATLNKKKQDELKIAKNNIIENIHDSVRLNNLPVFTDYFSKLKPDVKLRSELAAVAIQNGSLAIFKFLVQQGLNLKEKDSEGFSYLHTAVFYNQLPLCQYLVEAGLDINAIDENRSVFILASNSSIAVVEYLLNKKINTDNDPDFVNEAIRYGKPELAQYMMKRGFKFNTDIFDNDKLLVDFIEQDDVATFSFLLGQGLDINKNIKYRMEKSTLLYMAVLLNSPKVAMFLLNKGANSNVYSRNDALFAYAINFENKDLLNTLYDKGANLEAITGMNKQTPLVFAFKLNRIDVIMMLINRGAKLDHPSGDDKNMPLHLAAAAGYLDAVKLMIKKGANPNAKNGEDKTALDSAIENGQKAVEKYLATVTKKK